MTSLAVSEQMSLLRVITGLFTAPTATMLSYFEVFTTSGIVLFSQDLASSGRQTSLINSFVKDVFIEGVGSSGLSDGAAANNPPYRQEKHTLRWTVAKDLGLVFVAVYQSLVQLEWVNKLLDNLKTIFCELYQNQVRNPYVSAVECSDFKAYFDQQVRELEGIEEPVSLDTSAAELTPPSSSGEEAPPPNPGLLKAPIQKSAPTSADATPIATPDTSRPGTPGSSVLVGSGGPKGSRRARRAAHAALNTSSTPASSGDESRRKAKTSKGVKPGRKWNADGLADEEDDVQLDYSTQTEGVAAHAIESVDASKVGTRTKDGFLLNEMDIGDEVHSILRGAESKNKQSSSSRGLIGSGFGKISDLFSGVVGGKLLTKEALEKPMRDVEKLLIEKNVAREVAVQICTDVENQLLGTKTGSFESVDALLRSAVTSSLQKLLTPTSSLDILRDIASATTTINGKKEKRPWVASLLGVNGCGKSTHLSKIAYFCLQNRKRILVAAGDSFRAGAVEQLRVHVNNLSELCERDNTGYIELFERGYGQDAAVIAKQAVQYATANKFDCVLVDTAGRQSNSHLMGSLEKFVQMVQPDAIWLVAEAVVGSDSVAQARRFNDSLGRGRKIDGYIISKCDVVDDMIGTIVNMVATTKTPAVFLGVGQHYGDLRAFSASWATNLLLR